MVHPEGSAVAELITGVFHKESTASEFTMRLALVVLVSVLVGGCSKATPLELAELVIRSQFRDVPADAVACISVDGRDADEQLLSALKNIGSEVMPGSACVYVADPSRGSYERKSGRKAVIVEVVTRPDQGEAEYLSRYHAKWAMRVVLKVRHENGVWRVVDVVLREAA